MAPDQHHPDPASPYAGGDEPDVDRALASVKARSDRRQRTQRTSLAAALVVVVVLTGGAAVRAGSSSTEVFVAGEGATGSTDGASTVSVPGTRVGSTTSTSTATTVPDATTSTQAPLTTTTTASIGASTSTVVVTVTSTTAPPTTTVLPTTDPPTTETVPPTTTPDTTTPDTTIPPGTTMTLDEARALWAAHRPARYSMRIGRSCFCPEGYRGPFDVVIEGTTVVSPADLTGLSVDDLYDAAARIGPGGSITELRVDPATGVPLVLNLDPITMAVDDEMYYEISGFTPLP